ncbi:MAG: hypothetical protein OHK0048_15440 [Rhodoferax sp.]
MHYSLKVTGMTCEHCEQTVARAVRRLDKAAQVHADRHAQRAEVDTETLSEQAVIDAIVEEGFEAIASVQ